MLRDAQVENNMFDVSRLKIVERKWSILRFSSNFAGSWCYCVCAKVIESPEATFSETVHGCGASRTAIVRALEMSPDNRPLLERTPRQESVNQEY